MGDSTAFLLVGEGGGGGGGGDGGGAAAADDEAALAPLVEEAEALQTRVGEMERLTAKGCAPAMRALVSQRLATVDERLTQLMIKVDALEVSEGSRDRKKALTRSMDALGSRVAAIAIE